MLITQRFYLKYMCKMIIIRYMGNKIDAQFIFKQIRKLSQKSTKTRFNNSDSIVCLANYNEENNQTSVEIEIYNRSTVYLARSKRRCISAVACHQVKTYQWSLNAMKHVSLFVRKHQKTDWIIRCKHWTFAKKSCCFITFIYFLQKWFFYKNYLKIIQ